MGRRSAVSELEEEQFNYVVECICNGRTDREISVGFQKQFGKNLAKSSLNRWRNSAGNELAERYQLVRYQARQLLVDLKEDDQDAFQVVMRNIEERLLTATREVIAADPVKMLKIRLDEEKRRLKSRELDIKERQLEYDLSKSKAVKVTPSWMLEQFLAYVGDDPKGLVWFRAHAKKLEQYLSERLGSVGADA